MFVEANEDEPVIERVAALDIGKAEIMCCIRLPAGSKKGAGAGGVDLLDDGAVVVRAGEPVVELDVQRVVMEATSDYWRPPFYLFAAHGPWLVNAKDVKHLPGRPKTDKLDAIWLCKVAERAWCGPASCPRPISVGYGT